MGLQGHNFIVCVALFGQLMPANKRFSQRSANQGSGNKAEGSCGHCDGIGPFQAHLFQQRRKAASRAVSSAHGNGTGGHTHQRTYTHAFGNAKRKKVLRNNKDRYQDNHHNEGLSTLFKNAQIALITH